jgi:hypothetical protein
MDYFTILFFLMIGVLLTFLIYQAVNMRRFRGQAKKPPQPVTTNANGRNYR